MASHSTFFPRPTLHRHNITLSFTPNRTYNHTFSSQSLLFGSSLSPKHLSLKAPPSRNRLGRFSAPSPISSSSSSCQEFDVVIVGAGIIGLTIARQFLTGSDLSVAIVDKAVPCSGATGAGQGYLWMAHKTPGSAIWDLTWRSHKLWKMLAESVQEQGMNPMVELGWKKSGRIAVYFYKFRFVRYAAWKGVNQLS